MTKTIKMSLVAAIAVAGLSSTVSAKPLEEAIKGVDISGTMVYRYDDKSDDKQDKDGTYTDSNGVVHNYDPASASNYYKIATTVKAPVNDMVTANVRIVTEGGNGITGDSGLVGLNTSSSQDANPSLNVTNANFAAKLGNTTVIAGKQGLTTPWTVAVDSDGNEQTGTGILALSNFGPVTLAAAYFNQTNLHDSGDHLQTALNTLTGTPNAGTEDIYTVAAMGSVAGVSLDAWYLDMDSIFDTYTLGAKTTIGPVTAEARYTDLDPNDLGKAVLGDQDQSLWYIALSGKVGPVGLAGTYAQTDKDGGLVALDDDAKTAPSAWNITTNFKKDADYYHLNANMDIMSGLNLAINYADVEYKKGSANTKVQEDETYGQLTHKMGKNLKTYIRYGVYNVDVDGTTSGDKDITRGRLQVEYKF